MSRWQRRTRLVIGASAVAFATYVAFQFKQRSAPAPGSVVVRADPGVVAQSFGGRLEHFELSHENAYVRFERQTVYADGSSKLRGVTISAEEKDTDGTFVAIAKEASISKDQSTIVLRNRRMNVERRVTVLGGASCRVADINLILRPAASLSTY